MSNTQQFDFIRLATPLVTIIIIILAGFIIEKVVLGWFHKLLKRKSWRGGDLILGVLRGKTVLWFVLWGFSIAIPKTPLTPGLLLLLQQILLAVFLLSITAALANIATGFVDIYGHRSLIPQVSLFGNIIRIVIYVLGILILLQSIGIEITPILAALGVGGLAVSLALQDSLSNLFSGIQILVAKQIRPGNYIKLATGQEGYIVDINWRNTQIRQLANNMVIVPNAALNSAILINYHDPDKQLAISVELSVNYDCDLEILEQITTEVAREVEQTVAGGVADFEPVLQYTAFGEAQIKFTVTLRAEEFSDQFLLKHEFIKRLHKRYQQEGIAIPLPLRNGLAKDSLEKV